MQATKPLALAASIFAVAMIWMVLLPAVALQPRVKQRLDWLEQQGIDASATFYTELEAMEEILRKQRRRGAKG
ncbi:MAG: hypothetical protein AAF961_18000 [Planctomycetota bacterium]